MSNLKILFSRAYFNHQKTQQEETSVKLASQMKQNNEKMWSLRRKLVETNHHELNNLMLSVDEGLKESYQFFNQQFDKISLQKNRETFLDYYSDYLNTLDNILRDPVHGQEIVNEFKLDERLNQLAISENRQNKLLSVIQNGLALSAAAFALVGFTALLVCALAPAVVPITLTIIGIAGTLLSGTASIKLDQHIKNERIPEDNQAIIASLQNAARFNEPGFLKPGW